MERDRYGRPAAYLGDGAYAAFVPELGEVHVYTDDGVNITNNVVLGAHEFSELLRFFFELGLESRYLSQTCPICSCVRCDGLRREHGKRVKT